MSCIGGLVMTTVLFLSTQCLPEPKNLRSSARKTVGGTT